MTEKAEDEMAAIRDQPHETPRRFVTWGARAALASPFVAVFGVAVGASIYTQEVSAVAGSGRFTVATVTALVALLLLGLALVALYLRQERALGAFGTGAFVLALVGTVLAAGGAWDQVFAVPYLADEAPAALDGETSGSLLAGFLVSFGILALGWALFAIATRRAGVLARHGATVLLVGALLALIPAPTTLRLLVLTIGVAMLARPTTARTALINPIALAAVISIAGCGGEDRLSDEETASTISETFNATGGVLQEEFHPIFQELEGVPENAPVPERVRGQLEQPVSLVARELRETADQVAELSPPEDAEEAVNSLVDAARTQADRLEGLPDQDGLAVRDLVSAVEPPTEELRRLGEAGIEIQLPAPGGG